jgi:hypothetical protein
MWDRYTPRKRVQANLARSDTLNSTVVYATHIPTSEPPLFPATESKYLWAPVVFIVMLKGCIFKASRSPSLSHEVTFECGYLSRN